MSVTDCKLRLQMSNLSAACLSEIKRNDLIVAWNFFGNDYSRFR